MKYTKQDFLQLDKTTLDFCRQWLFDTYKRYDLSKNSGKTKKIREYCQYKTDGLLMAYGEIKDLCHKLKNNGGNLCETISLIDEPTD